MVLLLLLLVQLHPCRDDAPPLLAGAAERAEQFDLAGAADDAFAAAGVGCVDAEIGGHYLRGMIAARDAYRLGGSLESLAPVALAIAAIDARAPLAPAMAAIARAVLQAAAAAAQSERDEMALLLDHARRLEAIQIEAGQPALLGVSAHEAAGDLWLQVHRYDEAERAYGLAAERVGDTFRVRVGRARVAVRQQDAARACEEYRRLLAAWGTRGDDAAEIEEARAYVTACPVR